MKKTIVLALGLALTAAGFSLPLSEASRDAYHAFMTQPENIDDYRHYTESHSSNRLRNFRLGGEATTMDQEGVDYRQSRNYRGSRYNFNLRSRATADMALTVRHSTDRIAPNTSQTIRTTYQPRTNITPAIVNQVLASLYTFENDQFSLLLPNGWDLTGFADEVHVYSNDVSDYSLRVKYFPKNTCGESLGFMTCAAQLGKAENHRAVSGAGKLEITSKIIRESREADTVLNRLSVKTDTYTEQFNARMPFSGQRTLSRYFVASPDGGVFLIEANADYREAAAYTEITKRVFDSFRIYPEGYGVEADTQ